MKETFLAVDFGAGSGRVMAGFLEDGKIVLEELHRFANRQIKLGEVLYWDFPALFQEMKNGIAEAVRRGYRVRSIGIDTWGVDFGLIDKAGNLLGNPVCYRDERTNGMPERFFEKTDRAQHYAEVGIQVMAINSLYHLLSMKEAGDMRLEVADRLLFMPDLFNYYLTGVAANEYTIASTSELLDAAQRTWSEKTLAEAGIPANLFCPLVMPGTVLGTVKADVAAELGLPDDVQVVAIGSHDTASAVFAAPFGRKGNAFLSSGTWSLLGTMLDEPICTEAAREAGFSNEGGINGICFLQNITGLWIVQRLMAEWKAAGRTTDYGEIISAAEVSDIRSILRVDAPDFQNPPCMETAIRNYCRQSGQAVPETQGDMMRCVCESLATRYKEGIDSLNRLLPHPVKKLNIIGGGCRNRLLNRLTANALGIPVLSGPVEATAIGNIALQIVAIGTAGREEVSEIIIRS